MKLSNKTPIILAVIALLAVVVAALAPTGTTEIKFQAEGDLLPLPNIDVSVLAVT